MKMIASIGERLSAKLANANDNAFKMRRLFKMYDATGSGLIHLDDLRMMMETFGIQLDDDSLLALYHVYDKQHTGYLKYHDLMKVLLDTDYYALYTGGNDVTQATADMDTVRKMVATIKAKFRSSTEELAKVLRCLDDQGSGVPCTLPRLNRVCGWAAAGGALRLVAHRGKMALQASWHQRTFWQGALRLA